jgi:hypothetical protein
MLVVWFLFVSDAYGSAGYCAVGEDMLWLFWVLEEKNIPWAR